MANLHQSQSKTLLILFAVVQVFCLFAHSTESSCSESDCLNLGLNISLCTGAVPLIRDAFVKIGSLFSFDRQQYIEDHWEAVANDTNVNAAKVLNGVCSLILLGDLAEGANSELVEVEENACAWLYGSQSTITECGVVLRHYCFRKEIRGHALNVLYSNLYDHFRCNDFGL